MSPCAGPHSYEIGNICWVHTPECLPLMRALMGTNPDSSSSPLRAFQKLPDSSAHIPGADSCHSFLGLPQTFSRCRPTVTQDRTVANRLSGVFVPWQSGVCQRHDK